jgi:hypothetical protein
VDVGIAPLLAELPAPIEVTHVGPTHAECAATQAFIQQVFRRAHGAEVRTFYPDLLSFSAGGERRAVLGYRDGLDLPMFSEQYLERPAHELASEHLGFPVRREEMVEVGNLALADPGHARWLIAACTAFLAAAGYRWVLFTATRPLANAFARMGLKPLPLAEADANRLPDRGASWGGYYAAGPCVYIGDIHAGRGKLAGIAAQRRPHLHALLRRLHDLGLSGLGGTGARACGGI